jgi:hypothetical protein
VKRALVIALLILAQIAHAGPHQILVLRSEGTADGVTRASVDTHVLRLAKNTAGKVDAGDITLTEAAAAVGCNPSEAACKDEVLATLGVDEVVATTVTATPTGFNVTVRRISKGAVPKAAQTTIAPGKTPDAKLDADIGPLFGLGLAIAPLSDATPAAGQQPPPVEPVPAPAQPAPSAAPVDTAPISNSTITAAPIGAVTQTTVAYTPPRRRWQKIGMGVGGGMMLLGILMWAQASGVQSDIDASEPRSHAEYEELLALERRGDELAGGGNLFFLMGAALGGVSAYYYVKAGRRARAQSARVTPTVFPGGAGVTLTFGGAR